MSSKAVRVRSSALSELASRVSRPERRANCSRTQKPRISRAIRTVHAGDTIIAPELAQKMLNTFNRK